MKVIKLDDYRDRAEFHIKIAELENKGYKVVDKYVKEVGEYFTYPLYYSTLIKNKK